MGEAFDRTGAFLGEAEADTAREVLEKLQLKHTDAAEFRIRTAEARQGEYNPPRAAATRLNLDNIEHAFTYQRWTDDQQQRGAAVTAALIEAGKAILRSVPECPTRTRALNNLIDARMLANAAITHDGRY